MIYCYSNTENEELDDALTYYVEQFLNDHLGLYNHSDKSVAIESLDDDPKGSIHGGEDGVVGACYGDRTHAIIELKLSEFKGNFEYLIETLTHELIHAKQLFTGELVNESQFITIWKGEEFINTTLSMDEYKALPWEKEAYARQDEWTQCMIPFAVDF